MKIITQRKFTKRGLNRLLILLVVIFTQLLLSETYAQTASLTIQERNKTVKELLSIIEKSTQVVFFYVDKDIDLNRLAELTVLYVSSDISFLVNEASRNALKERANITQKHFEEAISKFPPSISERQLKKYETFSNNRNFV